MMKKSEFNFFIDIGMGLTFFISFITGVLKFKESLLIFARIGIYLPTFWLNFIHDRIVDLDGNLCAYFYIIRFQVDYSHG